MKVLEGFQWCVMLMLFLKAIVDVFFNVSKLFNELQWK